MNLVFWQDEIHIDFKMIKWTCDFDGLTTKLDPNWLVDNLQHIGRIETMTVISSCWTGR